MTEPLRLYVSCRDMGIADCCQECHAVMAKHAGAKSEEGSGGKEMMPLQKVSWLRRTRKGWRPRVMAMGYFCCAGERIVEKYTGSLDGPDMRALWARGAETAKYQYRRRS